MTRSFKAFALIPARGGSKSLHLKNLKPLGGRPLLHHVAEAAKRCPELSGIYCSTDHSEIQAEARHLGVQVLIRPEALGADETPVLDVVKYHLKEMGAGPQDFIFLLQPTSPFLLPEVISACTKKLKEHAEADGIQTVTTFPHNFHAFNQRVINGEYVSFQFEKERLEFFNKQKKPKFFIFGNLVATQVSTLLEKNRVFPEKSLFHLVDREYALDVDAAEDFEYAEYLLQTKKVCLPWLAPSVISNKL